MKLYFAPLTCSLSPHIVLRELDIPFELIRVNNQTKRTADNLDFREINPKGYVAALVLENGKVLTEGPAILQYIADLRPDYQLIPEHGTWERIKVQELLNFITSELHSGATPLFNRNLPGNIRKIFREKLIKHLDYICQTIGEKKYLTGKFSIADAYLFTVLLWLPTFQINISNWPVLAQFMKRMRNRPAVTEAMKAEEESTPI